MKNVIAFTLVLLSFSLSAASLSFENKLRQVGEAHFQFLFWDVYDSALYSSSGAYAEDQEVANQLPLKLEIKYLRDIEATDLVENTIEQWQHLGLSESLIAQHAARITELWPNIKKQDQLALVVTADNSRFYFNNEELGEPLPAQFGVDFLAIWLSEDTSQPKLRKQLISGGKK